MANEQMIKSGALNISSNDFDERIELSGEDDLQKLFDAKIHHETKNPDAGNLYSSIALEIYKIPKFQRNFVWSKNQVAYFAFSLLKGIPIPPLYTFWTDHGNIQVLIDGQQRITALFLYFNDLYVVTDKKKEVSDADNAAKEEYEGETDYESDAHELEIIDNKSVLKFHKIDELCKEYRELKERQKKYNQKAIVGEPEPLYLESSKEISVRLEEIENELKSKYGVQKTKYQISMGSKDNQGKGKLTDISFSKFSSRDQQLIKNRSFSIISIDCQDESSSKIYTYIFSLLNSAGKQLNSQEIRNGIFWNSKLYEALSNYNKKEDTIWRKLYGKQSSVSKDLELLLKMLSLEYYSKKSVNCLVIDDDKLNCQFNWGNIMFEFSEYTKHLPEPETKTYINKLESFFDSLIMPADEIGKKEDICNMAVLEAIFVAWTKLNTHKNIYYSKLCSIGFGKKYPFPQIGSGKRSVNERLSAANAIVEGRYEIVLDDRYQDETRYRIKNDRDGNSKVYRLDIYSKTSEGN